MTLAAGMLALLLVAAPDPSSASSPVTILDWRALGAESVGEISPEGAPHGVLTVKNEGEEEKRITVATIEAPSVTSAQWLVRGRVRYEDVEGEAFLETINTVDGREYFSRTLSKSGPSAVITGTSGWRNIVIPFDASRSGRSPTKVVLNVVLPGRGTVHLGEMALVDGAYATRALFSPNEAGIYFGIAGALFGILAGLMGTLAGRGASRAAVMTLWSLLMASALVALAFGLGTAAIRQPWFVTGPLIGLGLLGAAVLIPLRKVLSARYSRAPGAGS